MTLHIIGIGLNNEKDISLRGLELVKKSNNVYLEYYTSKLEVDVSALEKLYGKKIIVADRELCESEAENTILSDAKKGDTAFLVIGDAFSATTHIDLYIRAKNEGIDITVTHNASALTAIGITGLQLYKFGKTTSVPFPQENFKPITAYDILVENKKIKAHTLILLDLRPLEGKFMSVKECIEILIGIESEKKKKVFTSKTLCVACGGLGSDKPEIKVGAVSELINMNMVKFPQLLIVPSKMHFMEEEALEWWKKSSEK